jgi:hypothetical protein
VPKIHSQNAKLKKKEWKKNDDSKCWINVDFHVVGSQIKIIEAMLWITHNIFTLTDLYLQQQPRSSIMRLASSVGVFAVGLPPTTSLSSAFHTSESTTAYPELDPSGLQEHSVQNILNYGSYQSSSLANIHMAAGMFRRGQRTKRQKNVYQHHHELQKDCDPLSFEADLGILSCGYKEYCEANEDSELGGRCVEASDFKHRAVQQQNKLEYYTSALCYNNTYCTCSNIKPDEYSGLISCDVEVEVCAEYPNICDTAVEICSTYKRGVEFIGVGAIDYQLCLAITQPTSFNMCVYSSFLNATAEKCSVKFNAVECNSCGISPTPAEICFEDGTCYNDNILCYHFDCTNAEGGWAGTDCFPFYEYGCDVVECSICGEGEEVTLPDATFKIDKSSALPNVTSLTLEARCGDTIWLNSVSAEQCGEIQSLASKVCGCTTGVKTQAPSSNSTSPTEPSPSNPPSGSSQILSSRQATMVAGFLMLLVGSAGGLMCW